MPTVVSVPTDSVNPTPLMFKDVPSRILAVIDCVEFDVDVSVPCTLPLEITNVTLSEVTTRDVDVDIVADVIVNVLKPTLFTNTPPAHARFGSTIDDPDCRANVVLCPAGGPSVCKRSTPTSHSLVIIVNHIFAAQQHGYIAQRTPAMEI